MFENLTLYEALEQTVKEYPSGMAIYYRGRKISYKHLLSDIDRMAIILHNTLHIREGDIILLAQPNIPDTLVLFYALNKIGSVVNLVHPFTPFNQIQAIFTKTHSKYAFLFEQRVAKEVEKYREISHKIFVTRIENYLPSFSKFIYHGFMNNKIRKKLGRNGKFPGFNYVHELQPTGMDVITEKYTGRMSIILHSGSTTGEPKSICLSDRPFNYIASHTDFMVGLDFEQFKGYVMLSVLPSFHGFGLEMTMHLPLVSKIGIALVPKFTVKEVVKALNDTHFKLACGVPTMYEKLFANDLFYKNPNFKNIIRYYCGGDALNSKLKTKIDMLYSKVDGNQRVFEGYGLTEALAVNCMNTPQYHKNGSIGKPIPGCQVGIFDSNGQMLPAGEVGEIALKTEAMMLGYFKDEEGTKTAIRDGWLFTGDYGHVDEDGFVYFKSRVKRVVKVSGVAVFPSEVEKLIESVPGVEKVAAFGVPDHQLQSAIKICVVTNYLDKEEMKSRILETCRRYLIRWSVPKYIEFRDSLPVTKLGKVDYKVLEKESNED